FSFLQPAGRDVVFLLDGSDATRSGFPAMRDFVQKQVTHSVWMMAKDRVSVVQYSSDPAVQFYLNTYTTKERSLTVDNVFTASAGSRRPSGVPQVLILITGGRSFDSIDEPASALKQLGVLTIAIGTRGSDPRELQTITGDSLLPWCFLAAKYLIDQVKHMVNLMDVVFLLDGSDATRSGFPAMRDFVQKQVDTLSVDDGKDRVSVVQYSSDPAVQFYLNTYTTKREVLDSVRAALRYLRDNVFTASAGSRRPSGVPQVLILITGGRSFDSIDEPASALKQLGVLTIAIGTRGSDPRELQTITGEPSHAVSVSEFTDLPNVQEQLSSVMSTVPMRVVRQPAGRDVVFLLDGSDATRSGFPAMRDFVQKQVDTLSVDDGKDRVSVVQYSSDPAVQFYLNTYTTKREVLDSVRGLRHKGGRPLNTGAALRRRPSGVPQVLILITGGRSFDSIDEPASALKQLGVLTIAIGTRGSDPRELQTITGEPSYALSVSELTDLPKTHPVLHVTEKDIVFLLDGSDGTRNVVEKINVGENKDHVSVVQYSREPEVHFYLNTYTTREDVVDSVRGLRHRGGRPLNTGAALQYVRDNVFTNSSGSRRLQGVPQILILLTGGRSFDNVDSPASALKQQGIYVIGIGTRPQIELQTITGEPSHAVSVSEFTDLPNVQEQLSSVMSTVPMRVTPLTPTVTGRDVVFLLDGSDATRIDTLSVDDGKDRVSVVQYSSDPAVQFYLNTYTTKREVLDSVRGLRHKGGRPLNTGAALRYLRDNVFTASAGSRRPSGVPQVLILITGGRSFDSIDEPASALKQLGVLTIAIGTRGSDPRELQTITGEPSYALSVSELTDLPKASVVKILVFIFLSYCLFSASRDRKDIVFLLDGSDGTRNGFPAMRDFVERVVEKINVGENKDHVSVVQYSREPEVHFYLNTYTTREDVVDSVRGLRHRGGRPLNTGAALQYVRDNVFTNSSGSRPLKQQGIYVIGIGTRTSDARELQKISYEPSYALSVSEFTDLPSVQEQLSSVMSKVIVRATPMTPTVTVVRQPAGRDVVFLLDGSDATRSGFPAMRDFVQKQVDTLSVDDGKDRVSVVQYSSDPAVQFYLNTYTTKREVLDSVRGLRHKGGRPLNTGAALRYLRDNVFTASAGSRRPSGVPQVLILITGGRSFDSIDEPASALKQLGVLTIAIGTRGSDPRELQTITGEPSHAVSVSEFTDLPNVQEQLSSVMSTVPMRVTPLTPTVTGKNMTHLQSPVSFVPVKDNLTSFVKGFHFLSYCLFSASRDRKDIVFLLDGSDGTRNGFPAMRDFVERVVEKINVGENKDHVSVVQYSREPEVHFYLNTYTTREDVWTRSEGLDTEEEDP
uniref:VWFA domain-containing protein n=1 Tax=Maylandia zebra TaxID=106582 RepID=A0A3P9DTN3_9CICH